MSLLCHAQSVFLCFKVIGHFQKNVPKCNFCVLVLWRQHLSIQDFKAENDAAHYGLPETYFLNDRKILKSLWISSDVPNSEQNRMSAITDQIFSKIILDKISLFKHFYLHVYHTRWCTSWYMCVNCLLDEYFLTHAPKSLCPQIGVRYIYVTVGTV